MEPVKVTWQVDENTRGTWRDFPTDLNFLVDQAHKNRKPGVLYFWPPFAEHTEYTIDFNTMIQTNTKTGFKRKVRRVMLLDEPLQVRVDEE